MEAPDSQDTWCAVTTGELPIDAIYQWCVRPDCGAVVLFSGTVRDHAEGRDGVTHLDYEAYDDAVVASFEAVAEETRRRHRDARRVAIIHRTGQVRLGESSVIVAVSSAHRPVAFDAARFAIDAVKESAPIWKKEHWAEGSDWGTGATGIIPPGRVGRTA